MSISSTCSVFVCLVVSTLADDGSYRLLDDLFRKERYNRMVRPVRNNTDTHILHLGMSLLRIVDVDEPKQIITLNIRMNHRWRDYKLSWDPEQYDGVLQLHIPTNKIWMPDIVHYNSADADLAIESAVKATVDHTGIVTWNAPANIKSMCSLNVQYFPFDDQECFMKYSSWSYGGYSLDIHLMNNSMDLSDYHRSVEWDLLGVPAFRRELYYPCCSEPYPNIQFHLFIRRKTLFYTMNLILPSIAICCATPLVFYIPVDSGEKISLGLTIMNSLNFFRLLISEITPPSSVAIPLIGEYLLFTMILVTCSILMTILVLNIHFRTSATHIMSPCLRYFFLQVLPRCLFMQRPPKEEKSPEEGNHLGEGIQCTCAEEKEKEENASGIGTCPSTYGPQMMLALEDVNAIADHFQQQRSSGDIDKDWQYMASVLDRLFLWIFTAIFLIYTCLVFTSIPSLNDDIPKL